MKQPTGSLVARSHSTNQQGQALLPGHQSPQGAFPPFIAEVTPEGGACRLNHESNPPAVVWVCYSSSSAFHTDLEATSPKLKNAVFPCPCSALLPPSLVYVQLHHSRKAEIYDAL